MAIDDGVAGLDPSRHHPNTNKNTFNILFEGIENDIKKDRKDRDQELREWLTSYISKKKVDEVMELVAMMVNVKVNVKVMCLCIEFVVKE